MCVPENNACSIHITQGAKVFEAIRRQTDMLSQMQYLIKDLKVSFM